MRRVWAIRAARLRYRRRVLRWRVFVRARVAAEGLLADFFFVLTVFLAVVDFFVAAAEWREAETGDCAANLGTDSNSDNTPVMQSAAERAAENRGTTTIMFSLYADFA